MATFESVLNTCGGFGYYQGFVLFWYVICQLISAGQMGFMVFGGIAPVEGDCHTNDSGINVTGYDNEPCLIYKQEFYSLPREWDLAPKDLSIIYNIISVQFAGMFFGPLIAGQISDRFGRKWTQIVGFCFLCIFGLASTACRTPLSYTVIRFFIGFGVTGVASVQFVQGIEMLPSKFRTLLNAGAWPIGFIFLGLMAKAYPHWRNLTWATFYPAPVALICSLVLYESPKWLLETGQTSVAIDILHKIAKWNRAKPSQLEETIMTFTTEIHKVKKKTYSFWHLFTVRKRAIIVSVLMYSWFTTGFNYFAVFYNVGSISGDAALNTILIMLCRLALNISIPISERLLSWLGRKQVLLVGLSGVCCSHLVVAIIYLVNIPKENRELIVRLAAIIGLGFTSLLWAMSQVLTAESVPTVLRNMGYGLGMSVARLGGMAGPQVYLLMSVLPSLPSFIYAASVITCAILIILLVPETRNRPLPDLK